MTCPGLLVTALVVVLLLAALERLAERAVAGGDPSNT